jgi:hypothetical protein
MSNVSKRYMHPNQPVITVTMLIAFSTYTIRNIVIGYVLSESIHLKLLLDHISITIQYLNY